MNTWESGRATEHINDIIAGTKTIEGRLYKDKFTKYKVGDIINLREDIYNTNKELIKEIPNRVKVRIIKLEKYVSFEDMLKKVGYKRFLPRASSLNDALDEYNKFYSKEAEHTYGVLAIFIKTL